MTGYDNNNIFAKILRGEAPCTKVFEDEKILAFNDISPSASAHILVIPKAEYVSFDDFARNSDASEIDYFFKKVQEIAKEAGLVEGGYRIVSNHGKFAGQIVPHFHVHILGGEPLGGLTGN